jgi:hypothetical protein
VRDEFQSHNAFHAKRRLSVEQKGEAVMEWDDDDISQMQLTLSLEFLDIFDTEGFSSSDESLAFPSINGRLRNV